MGTRVCARDGVKTVTWERTRLVPDLGDFPRAKDRTWEGPKRGTGLAL